MFRERAAQESHLFPPTHRTRNEVLLLPETPMLDNVSAVGELGGPGGPGMGGRGGFCGGLTAASGPQGWGCDKALATELKAEDKEWIAITNLGHLVKDMKVKCLKEIYLSLLPAHQGI